MASQVGGRPAPAASRRRDREQAAPLPEDALLHDGGAQRVGLLYDDYVKAERLLDYIAARAPAFGTATSPTAWWPRRPQASATTPKMNRFIAGRRLYQRNHVAVTFSMKRKRLDKEAKLSAVKLRFTDARSPSPRSAGGSTTRSARALRRRDLHRQGARLLHQPPPAAALGHHVAGALGRLQQPGAPQLHRERRLLHQHVHRQPGQRRHERRPSTTSTSTAPALCS